MFPPEEYLDLNHTEHRMLFDNAANAWDALKQITSYLQFRLKPAINARLIGKPFVSGAVFVGKGTVIEQGAMIKGPAWIGEGCEIRNGCYIRENVIVGSSSMRRRFRISTTWATPSSATAGISARA
jgi:UDP-N-acetylglucosamine diphosphorylase / glucose-1-phosphate thymidylyltransferase / UDP-N-acetylgalactosamine diphosphorylase / glucosamine-1-phosphate N-acetyltransferase / galactosamine-1-phosphate N-acetyltransferase